LTDPDDADWELLSSLVAEHCAEFGADADKFQRADFVKLYPFSARPYGKLYTY